MNINPLPITGPWTAGVTLDRHTLSSEFLGYDATGRPIYDTVRSELGELLYQCKYRRNGAACHAVADAAADFVRGRHLTVNVVVPVPPSKVRSLQPLAGIASRLAGELGVEYDATSLQKVKETPELKGIEDMAERQIVLADAFGAEGNALQGKLVLLIDDLSFRGHIGRRGTCPSESGANIFSGRLGVDTDKESCMTCVFLGGSRKVSRLNEAIREKLREIVRRDMQIIVGDANGADRALQAQLADWRYPHVTVYHVGATPRNNEGAWPTHRIATPRGVKGFAFYAAKDRAMADQADCGLMLWDGSSRGTLANVDRLVKDGKPVAVYVRTHGRFANVRTVSDLEALTGDKVVAPRLAGSSRSDESQVALEFPKV